MKAKAFELIRAASSTDMDQIHRAVTHTPLGWVELSNSASPKVIDVDCDFGYVQSLHMVRKEHADYIVRAVNCHADLVAVVQAYLGTVGNKKGKPDLADVDAMARAALAKAQG